MNRYFLLLLTLFTAATHASHAQKEKRQIKHHIVSLSAGTMHGRGYVNKGGEKAANYIRRTFIKAGISAFKNDSSYMQKYNMPVNTFPGKISVTINKKELVPGVDYLVYGASSAYSSGKKEKLRHIDASKIKDSASWAVVKAKFQPGKAYYLKGSDTVSKYLKLGMRQFAKEFPKNLFIIPKHGKLIWTANQDTIPATILYVEDTVLPRHPRKALVQVETKFIPSFPNQNVIGYVPGTDKPDSFIVFSAHYDHLGRMGQQTIFPGAHDNASGTSVVLYLAEYFAKHPQRYSVAFMLFSGEEAGLVGSKYYANNPVFPLQQIRMVLNLDMTGDAANGITVVNATSWEDEFRLLDTLNSRKTYLPKLNKREQTQNSDHYSFSQNGVPAVFIYGNGNGKGHYHDVFDVAKELSLDNIDNLTRLLIEYTGVLSGGYDSAR